jgi:excinuclease ABC subunit A
VFFGTPAQLRASRRSLTGRYLAGRAAVNSDVSAGGEAARAPLRFLEILGAGANNLKDIDVRIPLNRLVCVTGVSGSGKSTLIQDVCYQALRKLKGRPLEPPGRHRAIRGGDQIDAAMLVDQSPIGRTTRSNPASYVGALDAIRKLFAAEPLARERGYSAGTFSFNSGTGRCPTCAGNGFEHVEMQFLNDVYLRCPDCDGRRYRPEVLEVRLLAACTEPARSIAEVLELTVSEALAFFRDHADVLRGLTPLAAVGLDYLKLGQPVPTLSGGEAQRLKLAGFLAKTRRHKATDRGTLFLFDEPTTGLHFDDIATLLRAFRQLVAEGHSLVVIEHNLDLIAAADWIIDLGPEGGAGGGRVVVAGSPEEILAAASVSHTARCLERDLAPGAI